MAEEGLRPGSPFRHHPDQVLELIGGLILPCRRACKVEELAPLFERLEHELPEVFEQYFPWFQRWRAENTLFAHGLDRKAALKRLASRPAETFKELLPVCDAYRYHGEDEVVLEVIAAAWPQLVSAPGLRKAFREEFQAVVVSMVIDRHVARDPHVGPGDPELLGDLARFGGAPRDWLGGELEARARCREEGGEVVQPTDLSTGRRTGPRLEPLPHLLCLDLWANRGWPMSRAGMARHELSMLLMWASAAPRRLPTRSRLAPSRDRVPLVTWDVLRRFQQDHADMYGIYPYRSGLLVEALPAWLTLAADRGLHELEPAREAWDECRHEMDDDEGFLGAILEATWDPDHTENVGWALSEQVPLGAGEGPGREGG